MKALLLDGSSATTSHTNALLQHLATLLQNTGYEASVVNLRERDLPVNDPAYHDNPRDHPDQKVRDFVQEVADADVIVLGTPLYHGSFSGVIKSALDHLVGEAFKGKPVGIVSNAAGIRVSQQAAQHLAVVARTMEGRVSHRLIGTTKSDYTEQNSAFVLTDPAIIERSNLFIKDLLELV